MTEHNDEQSWPAAFPDLERLDELLKCGICYDYVKTALVTPCSHNFCSLCIRKYMQYKTSCPACYVMVTDTQLRCNRVLDELVIIIERVKAPLCKALKLSITQPSTSEHATRRVKENPRQSSTLNTTSDFVPSTETPSTSKSQFNSSFNKRDNVEVLKSESIHLSEPSATSSNSNLNSSLDNNTNLEVSVSKSPDLKVSESSAAINNSEFNSSFDGKKNLQFLQSKNTSKLSESTASSSNTNLNASFERKTIMESPRKLPVVRTVADMLMSPTKKPSYSVPSSPRAPKESQSKVEDMAECPVCTVNIPTRNINLHLDACLKRAEMPSSKCVPEPVTKSRHPLPKLVYRLLNDRDLKRKLAELKLPTQGDRKTLEKRHQRYLVLYNSECDKENPRPIIELQKQLEKEEKEESRSNCKTWVSLQVDRKADPKQNEQAQKKYLKENKASFASLIADIKRRKDAKKASTVPSISASPSTSQKDAIVSPSCEVIPESPETLQEESNSSSSPPLPPAVYSSENNSQNILTVKSPILSHRKKLFESYETVPTITPTAVIEISDDDSVCTEFSESDFAEIDALTEQSLSMTEQTCQQQQQQVPTSPEPELSVEEDSSGSEFQSSNDFKSPVLKPLQIGNRKTRKRVELSNNEPRRSSRKKQKCST